MNLVTRMSQMARTPGDPEVLDKGPTSLGVSDRAARVLGWFSLGLGAAELLGARRLAAGLGLSGKESLIRAYGAREIGSGVLSLSLNKDAGIASRVAGDLVDIATLATARRTAKRKRENATAALVLVLGVTAVDIIVHSALKNRHSRRASEVRDYGDRSGFPGGTESARGAALDSFETPDELRV